MSINTAKRSDAPELMDDFALEGEILRDALDKLASINKILGGNSVTIGGVKDLIASKRNTNDITILDVGCGNGDMLRVLADYALKHGLKFQLTGIDANEFTINYARKLSTNYSNITYLCEDIFDDSIESKQYDIILCTLTLHHFKDEEILKLLTSFHKSAKLGIVINDLNRSKIAYYLFQAICFVFRLNKMSKDDGLVSILRGFKRKEILNYASLLKLKNFSLFWKWAFRYQWIIRK